jgi:nitrate reductase molybdenum cofactor assembly chaperone NarJ/NarW
MKRRRALDTTGLDSRIVHQVASWCLSYPDEQLMAKLPVLRAAVDGLAPSTRRDALQKFLGYADSTALGEQQRTYVDVFDVSRKHALYLSYWTDGDTRRRGEVLARFKQRYRASGFLVDTHGELPDFLPMVLEFAAIADPVEGSALLQQYRASLELLRLALVEASAPYAGVVAAVCATLPGESPADRATVYAMAAQGPPVEQVGLDDYTSRTLPIVNTSTEGAYG